MSNKNNKNFIPSSGKNTYKQKSGKPKPAFFVVLGLMIFWTIGSVFGIIAGAKSCGGSGSSGSMRTASAAEVSDPVPLRNTITYNGEKYFTFDIKGKGTSTEQFNYNLVVKSLYNFTVENCIYVISRKGSLPGSFVMRNIAQGSFAEVNFNVHTEDNPFDNGFQLYSFSGSSFDCQYFSNMIRDGVYSTVDIDLTFIITSQTPFNLQIPVLYENGFLNDICDASQSKDNDSLGFFTNGTFRVGNVNNKYFKDWIYGNNRNIDLSNIPYDSLPLLPSEYIVGFYNGVLNSFKASVIDSVIGGPQVPNAGELYVPLDCFRMLFCTFDGFGKSFGAFTNFSVFYKEGDSFYSYGDTGVIISFVFTDGTDVGYSSSSEEPLSLIDLSAYKDKFVRSVIWTMVHSESSISGLSTGGTNFADYSSGYNAGKGQGISEGYKKGYNVGLSEGKNIGYNNGVASANKYSFLGLLGAVVDAPIQAVSGLLNFDLLGFNMLNFFYALVTCALVIAVIRMIL